MFYILLRHFLLVSFSVPVEDEESGEHITCSPSAVHQLQETVSIPAYFHRIEIEEPEQVLIPAICRVLRQLFQKRKTLCKLSCEEQRFRAFRFIIHKAPHFKPAPLFHGSTLLHLYHTLNFVEK